MRTIIDGPAVCVVNDDFINLQESCAVFGDVNDFAQALAAAASAESITMGAYHATAPNGEKYRVNIERVE